MEEEAKLVEPQAAPVKNEGVSCWDLVVEDMKARDQFGRKKYGVPVQPHNGRDVLVDMYQELLDAVVYCRQAIAERDGVKLVEPAPVVSREPLMKFTAMPLAQTLLDSPRGKVSFLSPFAEHVRIEVHRIMPGESQ